MKKDPTKKTAIFDNIDRDLYDQFKSVCAARGITMKNMFIAWMQDLVNTHHSTPRPPNPDKSIK